jgi:hypothetical protein
MQLLDNMIVEEPKNDIKKILKAASPAINEDITSKGKEAAAITQKRVEDNKVNIDIEVKLGNSFNKAKETIANAIEATAQYQRAIKTTSQLQTEILKGLDAGEPIYDLFLKAVKAVSLATGNSLFYKEVKKDLVAIYGKGLKEQKPLEIKLEEVKDRLKNLEESAKADSLPADELKRIVSAIVAHKAEIEQIESILRG